MKRHLDILRLGLCLGALLAVAPPSRADVIAKADNADDLNLGTSWVGGVAPGESDIATWDAALGTLTYTLGADLAWLGLAIPADPGGNVTFNAGNLLTLGSEGIVTAPNRTITLRNGLALDADQAWTISANTFIPQGGLDLDGHTLTLAGGGTKQFKTFVTGPGAIVATRGTFKLSNTGSHAPDVDLVVQDSAAFSVDKDVVAGAGTTLSKSITLRDGRPAGISSSSKGDIVITNQNQLALGRGGQSRISIYQQGQYHTTFWSERLECATNAGNILFTGNQLGLFPSETMTNAVNILFGTAPALERTAGATGPTTIGVLRGATANHDNSEYGVGLVTYDETHGVRLLDFDTEYTSALVDGEDAGNNVRLANVGGIADSLEIITNLVEDVEVVTTNVIVGSTILTNHLTAPLTAVNTLSFDVTGPHGNAGIVLSGDEGAVLRLNTGILFARESGIGSKDDDATDITNINLPIDFNARQGFILNARTDGMSNGGGPALSFNASPVNDGGNGIMFAGHGSAYLQWPAPTQFTGPVIINSGWFRITGSGNDAIIPTKLILYGGSVQNHGNRIADSADIEIHGGTLSQKGGATNSGSGAHETFNNLVMTGGTLTSGASGTSSGSTTLTNACLSGGTWTVTRGHSVYVGGDIFLSGTACINLANADSGYRPTIIMNNGTITITNSSVNTEWTPIALGPQNNADRIPPRIVFRTAAPAIVFVGNDANTNAAVIAAEAGVVNARMEFNGTQTFDIGDGPAPVDLRVMLDVVDDGANAGALVKKGAGTLELAAHVSPGGSTIVSNGELRVTGSLTTPTTIEDGAVLSGTGSISNTVDFAQGSAFRINVLDENTADVLAVTDVVSGTATALVPETLPDNDGEWLVMTATSLDADFVSTNPLWKLYPRNNRTELWLSKKLGTLILVK
ncbi:MAG: hypothetical protein ACOX9C_07955 [Kiritimatiellia bacterium]|jgi:fibronectin-binding autotransporter adhesin